MEPAMQSPRLQGAFLPGLRLAHWVAQVCNADTRDHRRVAKNGWRAGEVVKESNSRAKEHHHDVDVDVVEEASDVPCVHLTNPASVAGQLGPPVHKSTNSSSPGKAGPLHPTVRQRLPLGGYAARNQAGRAARGVGPEDRKMTGGVSAPSWAKDR